jgi:hypothetical protein
LYIFNNNSPVNFIDPNGESFLDVAVAAVGVALTVYAVYEVAKEYQDIVAGIFNNKKPTEEELFNLGVGPMLPPGVTVPFPSSNSSGNNTSTGSCAKGERR